jgi:hypothetical protein
MPFFQTAARVFWISASAFVRGVNNEKQMQLLRRVSAKSRVEWYESADYVQIWKLEHDRVVNHYINKVQSYGTLFLSSEAGKKFLKTTQRCRKTKHALPTLDVAALSEFEGAKGIEWSYAEVYDIFSILGDVADTIEMSVQVVLIRLFSADI